MTGLVSLIFCLATGLVTGLVTSLEIGHVTSREIGHVTSLVTGFMTGSACDLWNHEKNCFSWCFLSGESCSVNSEC